MRGLLVNEMRLRELRQARGMTQQELARRAGVGERTVRNAEAGRRIRLEFLEFLAAVLEIDVVDLVDDREGLQLALREKRRVDHILSAMEAHAKEQDRRELIGLVSENILISVPGPEEIPICGEYRGTDGLHAFFDRSIGAIEYQQLPTIVSIRTGGNLVVINGQDQLRAIPTGKSIASPWMHVYEFDKSHIARIDMWSDSAVAAKAFQPG